MHIVWLTAGLGCDGDTIAMTAATNPSIEDLLLGGLPGVPKVHLHNPVLAYEVGDELIQVMHRAAAGELDPFILGGRYAPGRPSAPAPAPPTAASTP